MLRDGQGTWGLGGWSDTSHFWLCDPQVPKAGEDPDEKPGAVDAAAEVLPYSPERKLKEVTTPELQRSLHLNSHSPGRQQAEGNGDRETQLQAWGCHRASRATVI